MSVGVVAIWMLQRSQYADNAFALLCAVLLCAFALGLSTFAAIQVATTAREAWIGGWIAIAAGMPFNGIWCCGSVSLFVGDLVTRMLTVAASMTIVSALFGWRLTRSILIVAGITLGSGIGVAAMHWLGKPSLPAPDFLMIVEQSYTLLTIWTACVNAVFWLWAYRSRFAVETTDRVPVCPVCRYDFTGNRSGICPECGNAVDRVDWLLPGEKARS